MTVLEIESGDDGGDRGYIPPVEGGVVAQPTLLTNPRALENLTSVVTIPDIPRPAYRSPLELVGFGTKITRIGGDYGEATAIGGTWGKAAIHHYSKNQPWNHDETMIHMIQRTVTGVPAPIPSQMILDGSTYLPIIGNDQTANGNHFSQLLRSSSEFRWRPGYPTQVVSWNTSQRKLFVWDVLTDTEIWSTVLPANGADSFGFLGEGVISNDGRYVVVCSAWKQPKSNTSEIDRFYVIDLDNEIVGPANTLTTLPFAAADQGTIDWCSISPLGNYVVVKYSDTSTPEYARCFSINPATLVATPQNFLLADEPLQMLEARGNMAGWMGNMSHADFQISTSPTLLGGGAVEVMIGGIRDQSQAAFCDDNNKNARGVVVAQSMAKGTHVHISRGTLHLGSAREAPDQHCSGRNYLANGYMLVSYDYHTDATRKLIDELVIYKTDAQENAGRAIRLGTTRTNDKSIVPPLLANGDPNPAYDPQAGGYAAEAHGVPSPTFKKVMFASNWQRGVTSPGSPLDAKSYILESLEDLPAVGAPAPLVHTPPVVV